MFLPGTIPMNDPINRNFTILTSLSRNLMICKDSLWMGSRVFSTSTFILNILYHFYENTLFGTDKWASVMPLYLSLYFLPKTILLLRLLLILHLLFHQPSRFSFEPSQFSRSISYWLLFRRFKGSWSRFWSNSYFLLIYLKRTVWLYMIFFNSLIWNYINPHS